MQEWCLCIYTCQRVPVLAKSANATESAGLSKAIKLCSWSNEAHKYGNWHCQTWSTHKLAIPNLATISLSDKRRTDRFVVLNGHSRTFIPGLCRPWFNPLLVNKWLHAVGFNCLPLKPKIVCTFPIFHIYQLWPIICLRTSNLPALFILLNKKCTSHTHWY